MQRVNSKLQWNRTICLPHIWVRAASHCEGFLWVGPSASPAEKTGVNKAMLIYDLWPAESRGTEPLTSQGQYRVGTVRWQRLCRRNPQGFEQYEQIILFSSILHSKLQYARLLNTNKSLKNDRCKVKSVRRTCSQQALFDRQIKLTYCSFNDQCN